MDFSMQEDSGAFSMFAGIIIGVVSVPIILAVFGFGARGVVPRSRAASWNRSIGGIIASRSLFAFLQSAGTGGYAMFKLQILAGILGACIGLLYTHFSSWSGRVKDH
ncbi:uncharacterized protein F4822DRAFT_426756 [Hypoxylon trugodes]|uniref:uncharacterized protein n=1 Tax=Hypoxylon trugodes TaxID=326681 RepID=UPI002194C75C|nr:uncharacterized protein F4822DRAFT_426756 [Hypoxylon trugodes]KAI1390907.1 hypothetical protein F4822DRAFT_426756 [Hypoxylon trugodes]